MRRSLLPLLLTTLLACGGGSGDDDEPADGLAGDWVLSMGPGGQSFMHLEQAGAAITGESCESEGKDCYPLVEGTVGGFTLTFYYTFLETGTTHRVDGNFTISEVGTKLSGELVSTKCDCTLPHEYEKR